MTKPKNYRFWVLKDSGLKVIVTLYIIFKWLLLRLKNIEVFELINYHLIF